MTDPENQLHAAGSPTKHGGGYQDEGMRRLVQMLLATIL
jgi:hypothetical protein